MMTNRRNSTARNFHTTYSPKKFKFLRKWAQKYFNTLHIVFCMSVVMNPVQ